MEQNKALLRQELAVIAETLIAFLTLAPFSREKNALPKHDCVVSTICFIVVSVTCKYG